MLRPLRSFGVLAALVIVVSLSACGGSKSATGATTPSTTADSDGYEEKKAKIREVVPGWDEGSGIAVRFLKESTGERASLLFADTTAPLWNQEVGAWLIQGVALGENNAVLGHVLLGLTDLAPGTYEGNDEARTAVLAIQITSGEWNGEAPETSWSVNPNSYFRIVLRDVGDGNLEGDFQGKVVSNGDDGYFTVESGYIYINR